MSAPDAFDKLPPHSTDAEACLLASMMLHVAVADDVLAMARSDWFYLPDHGALFDAIRSLRGRESKVDAVLVRDELRSAGKLEEIGGAAFIAGVLGTIPSTAHWESYRDVVREKSLYREAIAIADQSSREAYAQRRPAEDILTDVATSVARTMADGVDAEVLTAEQVFRPARDRLANPESAKRFVTYGFPSLDKELTGIAPGELILIGARPSMGKSTLMRQMAVMAALAGVPVLYISLEESDDKIARNVYSWRCGIENKRMRSGTLDLAAMTRVNDEADRLARIPFYLVKGQSRADRLHAIIASNVAKRGVRVVYLDYLQLLNAGGKDDYERATQSSHAVCRFARELNVGVVCATQLSRDVAKREDKHPTMTDIRSSGQIEQDADVILLLHREDYYHTSDPSYEPTRVAELIRGKVRDGERGGESIKLKSTLAFQCFQDESDVKMYDEDKIRF